MSRIFKGIEVIFLAVAMASHAYGADRAAVAWDWRTRAPVFDPAATPSATPILLYFSAQWCGFCKQMDRTTLSDQSVRLQLAPLIHVKLDFDQEEELVKRFGISGIPAFVLVNERGEEISRSVGATDTLTFINWLKAGEKQAGEEAQAAQKLRSELHQLVEQAASKDPAVQAAVREQAFALLGRGEPSAQAFATDYLGHLVQSNPNAVLDGLSNPDLAIRIAIANILRSKIGDAATFDPWAAANERQAAIDQLRKTVNAGKLSE